MMRFTVFFAVIVFANAAGLYSLGGLGTYGLLDGSLSRQEIRSPDGIIRGTLTYIDGDGTIKSISYGGDNDAELLKGTSTEAPTNAEEERRDDAQNGEAEEQRENNSSEKSEEKKEENADESSADENQNKPSSVEDNSTGDAAQPALPQPVSYTPEVAAARAAHFAARDQAILLQKIAKNQERLEAQAESQAQALAQAQVNQQLLLSQPQILDYPPIFREYYGAAKPLKSLKSLNPYLYL